MSKKREQPASQRLVVQSKGPIAWTLRNYWQMISAKCNQNTCERSKSQHADQRRTKGANSMNEDNEPDSVEDALLKAFHADDDMVEVTNVDIEELLANDLSEVQPEPPAAQRLVVQSKGPIAEDVTILLGDTPLPARRIEIRGEVGEPWVVRCDLVVEGVDIDIQSQDVESSDDFNQAVRRAYDQLRIAAEKAYDDPVRRKRKLKSCIFRELRTYLENAGLIQPQKVTLDEVFSRLQPKEENSK